MTIAHIPAYQRQAANEGWLSSHRSFPAQVFPQMGYSDHVPLLGFMEDRVDPGKGFGEHGHRDMEILSYVRSGALHHRDSLGNEALIRPGEIQRMSAGTGIRHAEMNASAHEPVSFCQIWIEPAVTGIAPGYEQREYDRNAPVVRLAGGDEGDGVHLHQAATLWRIAPSIETPALLPIGSYRTAWLLMLSGSMSLYASTFHAGDALAFLDEPDTSLRALAGGTEALLLTAVPRP